VSGAVTTNKATISSIQTFMQGNLDLGVTSVGITFGTSGTDINASGSPVTSSGNITINLPTASASNRGALSSADWITFNAKQGAITLTTTGTSGASTLVGNTLNIPNYTTDLSGYVTLGTAQTITAQKTFTTSGSSDTMIISHGSGSGFALDVIKAGSGEAIRVNKTSGSGNAMTVIGGNFEAPTIVKTGGTSSQFLKADGSVDSSTYLTTGSAASIYLPLAGGTLTGALNGTSGTFTGAVSGSAVTITATTGIAGDFTNNSSTNETLRARNNGSGNIAAFRNLSAEVASITNSGGLTLSGALSGTSANFSGSVGIGTITPEGSGLTVASGGILVSLDPGVDRKVLELYATSTGAKVSSTYVGASSYGSLELLTSNVPRLTISDTGEATFSVNTNASLLITNSGQTPILSFRSNGVTAAGRIRVAEAFGGGEMVFSTKTTGGVDTDRIMINTSGNVGIGTDSPQGKLESKTAPIVSGDADYAKKAFVANIPLNTASVTGSGLSFFDSTIHGAAIGYGYTSPGYYMALATNDDTTGEPIERMRITPKGFTKASNDGTYYNVGSSYHEMRNNINDNEIVSISHAGSSPYGISLYYTGASPNNTSKWFAYFQDSTALRFEVRSNGGISNYQANDTNLSDERVKKDIEPLQSYWDKFKAIEIVKYKYKDQTHDDFNIGVIAQQVEAVAPEFVDVDGWNKPELDEEGNEIVSEEEPLKSIYTADLHHATIKVLQEAMAKIEKLETEIDSLKNQIK
jgi:hypothetical protein